MSITQTVVQLRAPREKKGQVIGVYGVAANGMRIGSGFTVGLLGAALGLRPALGWSAAALCACVAVLAAYLAVAARRAVRRGARPGRGPRHWVIAPLRVRAATAGRSASPI